MHSYISANIIWTLLKTIYILISRSIRFIIRNFSCCCKLVPHCMSICFKQSLTALQIRFEMWCTTAWCIVPRVQSVGNCLESCRSYIFVAVIISVERCKRKPTVIIWHNGTRMWHKVPLSVTRIFRMLR